LIHDLEHRIDRDKATGFTSVGPHRDDIEFYLDGKHMATNASRGEIRTLVLALKRYEIDQLKEVWQTPPLFLLDDVFSELDKTRQQQLTSGFYGEQMIITTTDAHETFTGQSINL
jgi:DNA replication and repair protein RecF